MTVESKTSARPFSISWRQTEWRSYSAFRRAYGRTFTGPCRIEYSPRQRRAPNRVPASWPNGYARVSGKPGVALVIPVRAVTNTITAMGASPQDSIPMLVTPASTAGILSDMPGAACTSCPIRME